jgi:predicted esterase
MFRYARSVAPPGAVVVAPEGPQAFYAEPWRPDVARRRVGYGWVADRPRDDAEARNRDLLARALDAAQAEHALDAARTCLLAYSQGVGVAADFAVHARERVSGLVGLAGGVPEKARASLAALAGLPVLWISGRRDPYYAPAYNDAVVAAWRAARVDLTTEVLDRGHDVLEPARERVRAWIAAQGCAGTGPGSAVP